jgi:hypothetical protein
MRVQGEHCLAGESGWSGLDHPHRRVAVLNREGKIAFLGKQPHSLVLARRHTAFVDESFGAAADPGVEGAYEHIGRRRSLERTVTQFGLARRGVPKGARCGI